MKRLNLLLLTLFLTIQAIFAQKTYELKFGRESLIGGAGFAIAGSAYYFNNQLDPFTELQLSTLRSDHLKPFERWVTSQRSLSSHKASDVLLYSSQLFPVALTLADPSMRRDAFTIAALYGETVLINGALTALVKNAARRTRPYVYRDDVPIDEKMTLSARGSFFSGHTSQTAAMCFLTARLYADYHPDSKWKPVVWTLAATIPATTGVLRMTAGKHFPTDVLAGYLTGAAIGYFLPKIHLRKADEKPGFPGF